MTKEFFKWCAAILLFPAAMEAGDFSVRLGDQPPPAGLAEPVRALLSPQPVQLIQEGKPVLQLWFRQELTLKAKPSSPSSAIESVSEATLFAAVSVEGTALKDYKDNAIPQGVFTARFAMQPQDGDHLGTAEFNTFLVLVSTEVDKAPDSFTKFTPLVKASGKLTSSGHPLIVSLRPASSADGAFPSLTEPVSDHRAIRVKLPGKASGAEPVDVVFEVVFEGHGHIQ